MPATWLVTGANRGIGLELARQLFTRGDRVIATARAPAEAAALADLRVRVEALDVASSASVADLARRLAGVPIDVLVNNAGIGSRSETLAELDVDALDAFFQVNALGPLRVTRALLPNLRAGARKLVAHVSTKLASISQNDGSDYYGYRASKAALNMIVKNLAIDLAGEEIANLLLHPGWVRTDMGGPRAPLEPRESVEGMLRVIDRSGPTDSGKFYDYTGAVVPW